MWVKLYVPPFPGRHHTLHFLVFCHPTWCYINKSAHPPAVITTTPPWYFETPTPFHHDCHTCYLWFFLPGRLQPASQFRRKRAKQIMLNSSIKFQRARPLTRNPFAASNTASNLWFSIGLGIFFRKFSTFFLFYITSSQPVEDMSTQ